ncbi:MAG: DUF4259 domain-containing protein [Acidimicrobiia bacterium]|nr:DUF4259 domain-containing protein [Acidimicrobiia bacterium]
MGTWGVGVFDNDVASDWTYGLGDRGLNHVSESLHAAADASEFLDADEGAEAVAAAETVARLRGGAWDESPYAEAVDEWVHAQTGDVPADLAALAAAAVRRVLAPGSELADLWAEAGEADAGEWRRVLDDLIGRLDV